MNKAFLVLLLLAGITLNQACTPNYGCTEQTADNYDLNADEDDGTCIPSRDKLIGGYTYTKAWTDVIFEADSVQVGTMFASEANTGNNEFNFFFDGSLNLQGSISQNNITLETHTFAETFFGFPWNRTYNGTGNWLESDSVDMYLQLVTQVPMIDQSNGELVIVPQTYQYYFTQQ